MDPFKHYYTTAYFDLCPVDYSSVALVWIDPCIYLIYIAQAWPDRVLVDKIIRLAYQVHM